MTSIPLTKSAPPSASIVNELPEYTAFKSAVVYCGCILILPILAFFTSKVVVFDSILSLSVTSSNVCSAICAVVVLHISLGAFIYKAYSGTDKTSKQD
ncbi:vacuolar ATPase assembly integral membrane protein VMA21 homolog [Planococcus citri]|uniref:vacuolar ATPase assembly integral membrane protein VMA21 homolog n=1 Tax=Planococcus citri TaxID=170843 RepID=UPI0031F9F591